MKCDSCRKEFDLDKGLALIDYEHAQKWFWFDSRTCLKQFLQKEEGPERNEVLEAMSRLEQMDADDGETIAKPNKQRKKVLKKMAKI